MHHEEAEVESWSSKSRTVWAVAAVQMVRTGCSGCFDLASDERRDWCAYADAIEVRVESWIAGTC